RHHRPRTHQPLLRQPPQRLLRRPRQQPQRHRHPPLHRPLPRPPPHRHPPNPHRHPHRPHPTRPPLRPLPVVPPPRPTRRGLASHPPRTRLQSHLGRHVHQRTPRRHHACRRIRPTPGTGNRGNKTRGGPDPASTWIPRHINRFAVLLTQMNHEVH